jgi:hypothetical protein
MVTAPAVPRFGTTPTLGERMLVIERMVFAQAEVIAEQAAQIAALQARADADDAVDGPAPQPLPDNWRPLPEAAKIAGFSWSGLRKRIKTHREGPRWWKRQGVRFLVDITAMPRRM